MLERRCMIGAFFILKYKGFEHKDTVQLIMHSLH
jgi:hypothetical protein